MQRPERISHTATQHTSLNSSNPLQLNATNKNYKNDNAKFNQTQRNLTQLTKITKNDNAKFNQTQPISLFHYNFLPDPSPTGQGHF